MLRYFNVSKVNYILRNMTLKPDSLAMDILHQLNDRMKTMITNFPLNKTQHLQAELPINKGGLACRNLEQFSCAARIANMSITLNCKK